MSDILNGSVEEQVGGMAPAAPQQIPTAGRADATGGVIPPNPQMGGAQIGQDNAPDFLSIARKAAVATAMSSEGSKYVKTLKEYLEAKNSSQTPIKVISLTYPPETLAVISGDNAFLLLFSEANRKEDNLPTISMAKSALQTLQSVAGNSVRMRNAIVVTPQDYEKPEVMGAHLINAFTTMTNSDIRGLNIQSLKKYQLEVSTNPHNYNDFNRRNDPHGMPARADLKMTVSVNVPKRNNTSNLNLFDQADADKMEIATIGAYVNFVQTQSTLNGMQKFIPEVHISSIVTGLPFEGIIPLLLALATDTLIDNHYWKAQFSDLGGMHSPNIGTLINDPTTGSPWRAENLQQRDQFIAMYCEPPVLILDVVEGRARIPGLEQYALPEGAPRIIGTYNQFLNSQTIPTTAIPGQLLAREYIGCIQTGAESVDSRWVDYLNMMIHHSSQQMQCKMLLNLYQREEDHVNIVRQFAQDLALYYVNHMVVLRPEVLRSIQTQVHSAIKTVNGNAVSGTVDISSLLSTGQGFISNPQGGYYQASQTPFGMLYGQSGMQRGLF